MWAAANIEPAAPASDSEFLRRAYLDLVGVIPRASEVREFLADQRPDKRAIVIDRLLASPRHSTHMATIVRNRILPLGVDPTHDREALGLQKWLRTRFAKNLRYDNLVGGLLLTSGGDELGPALYFRANDLAPEKMAGSAAELFLGLKLQCAECHDHPFADWKQRDFWGVAAFFARVKDPDAAADGRQRVSPGRRRSRRSDDSELDRSRAAEISWAATRRTTTAGNRAAHSSPPGWPRATTAGSRARPSTGRGPSSSARDLVDSLDDVDAGRASTDREKLLDELATYFVDSGFDLRNLWRTLANTRAYQLSEPVRRKGTPPPELFAYKLPRPLTPEQCYDSFMVLVPRDVAGQEWSRMATQHRRRPAADGIRPRDASAAGQRHRVPRQHAAIAA